MIGLRVVFRLDAKDDRNSLSIRCCSQDIFFLDALGIRFERFAYQPDMTIFRVRKRSAQVQGNPIALLGDARLRLSIWKKTTTKLSDFSLMNAYKDNHPVATCGWLHNISRFARIATCTTAHSFIKTRRKDWIKCIYNIGGRANPRKSDLPQSPTKM